MNRTVRTIVALAAAIVAAIALVGWIALRRPAPASPEAATPQTPVAIATQGTLAQTIHLSGRAGPPAGTQTKLSFPVAGTVATVLVQLGERVSAGQPLAQLDATTFSLAARQAQADAAAAAANASAASVDRLGVKLKVDEQEVRRQQRLYAAGVVALRDVQAAQASLAADRAEHQGSNDTRAAAAAQSASAEARAQSAAYDLARAILRAPASGTVTAIYVQPGEAADPTTPALAFTPQGGGSATLDVPVADAARIAAGDPVDVRAGSARFQAGISGVAPAVNSSTGLATAGLRGVPPAIPAGTPLDATVIVGHVRGVIVPRGAIVEDPQTGNTLVFVQTRTRDGVSKFEARIVTVDGRSDDRVRVTSGLRPGERVAAQGAIDLLAPSDGGN